MWYADNPDTFQYLSIAEKYLSGDWSFAVNGYWSPMISWLLALFLFFLKDGILAFKILQLIIGLFTLWQWNRLLHKTPLCREWKNILSIVSIPFILDSGLLNATPDLLFMCLLLMLINVVISGGILNDKRLAIKAGITGGLLYLTKSYGFPFFIAFIIVVILLERNWATVLNKFWKNISALFGVFFLISFFWIAILSFHYDKFTISKAAQFNRSAEAAPLPGRQDELPVLGSGLLAPMANSYSAWESPGEYLKNREIISQDQFFKIFSRNVSSIYYYDFRHQTGALFIILMIIFIARKGIRELVKTKWVMIIFIFIFIFYGGYALILVHARYTWINNLLMILLSAYFIQFAFELKHQKIISMILFGLLVILSIKRPIKEILVISDKDYPILWMFKSIVHPFETMRIFYRPDFELQKAYSELKGRKILSGNVASLKVSGMERDGYTSSLLIARSGKARYFGQLNDTLSFLQQDIELKENKIDFFITWKTDEWNNKTPFYENVESGLKIYSLK